jgi:hypothetical protein
MVGGNVLSGLLQGDQEMPAVPRSYTGLLSPEQVSATNSLIGLLMSGGGDFGGAATRQANTTLMDQMARRGIDPNGKFAASAQAGMMGNIAAQAGQNRHNTLLQLLNSRPGNQINYQNLGYGFEGTPFGQGASAMSGITAARPSGGGTRFQRAWDDLENQAANRYRSGGTY